MGERGATLGDALRAQRDGCYRCLYGRGTQREIDQLSKELSIRMLSDMVAARARLLPIETLSNLSVYQATESELEERFSQRFREQARQRGYGIVRDDSARGWILNPNTAASPRLRLLEQVRLGRSEGVMLECRPDFLLEFTDSQDQLPIAIFCDGLRYHAKRSDGSSIVHDDIAKRAALVRSAKYRVWTVTWDDVQDDPSQYQAPPWLPASGKAVFERVWKQDASDAQVPMLSGSGFEQLCRLVFQLRADDWQVLAHSVVWGWLHGKAIKATEAQWNAGGNLSDVGGTFAAGDFHVLQCRWQLGCETKPKGPLRWRLRLDDTDADRARDDFVTSWRLF